MTAAVAWRRLVCGSRSTAVALLVARWRLHRRLLATVERQQARRQQERARLDGRLQGGLETAAERLAASAASLQDLEGQREECERQISRLRRRGDHGLERLFATLGRLVGGSGSTALDRNRRLLEAEADQLREQEEQARAVWRADRREAELLRDPVADVEFALEHLAATAARLRDELAGLEQAIDAAIWQSCRQWSEGVWQQRLTQGQLPDGLDIAELLRRRDRIARAVDPAVADAPGGPVAPGGDCTAVVASSFLEREARRLVPVRVSGHGHRHVRRTSRNANGGSSTSWRRVGVDFRDRIRVGAGVTGTGWDPTATAAWLGDLARSAIAQGRSRQRDHADRPDCAEDLHWFRQRLAPGVGVGE